MNRKEYLEALPNWSLPDLVERFFEILEVKEESDNGNIFNPTRISCCRALTCEELDILLAAMKKKAKEAV